MITSERIKLERIECTEAHYVLQFKQDNNDREVYALLPKSLLFTMIRDAEHELLVAKYGDPGNKEYQQPIGICSVEDL